MTLTATEQDVLTRLRDDHPFHAQAAVRIVDRQQLVPLTLRPEQLRFWEALKAQKESGRPMRAFGVKARKIGMSTQTQSILFQRTTQRPHHASLTVAHDSKTASEVFQMAELMHRSVPQELRKWLAPEITNRRKGREMYFGRIGSKMQIDTAREYQGGRGFTYHSVHLSEVAFWPDIAQKMTSILNAVPDDDPDTLIVIETTVNSAKASPDAIAYLRGMWVAAMEGRNDYLPFFSPWYEDPRYSRVFRSEDDLATFEASVGGGPWGEDEPGLLELGLTVEQLHWRRWAIENKAGSDLQTFQAEYPSTWEEAFAVAGRNAFAAILVRQAITRAKQTDPEAETVVLETTKTQQRSGRFVEVDVPTAYHERALPEHSRSDLYWRIWDRPSEKGQYIVVVDPASEDQATDREPDWTGIQILDHKLRVQVAEMQTRAEKDLVAEQVFLACLMFTVKPNRPLLVVEMTGGYGDFLANRIYKEYGYKRMYWRKPTDPRRREDRSDLLGFSTNRNTKPRLVDGMRELLRERSHGIRSLRLAGELASYQKIKSGKMQAARGSFDDLLSSFMIAHLIAQEVPVRPDRTPGNVVSLATKALINPRTGY